ncbi:putative Srb7pRNA polymerase II holoenzyme component [Operophtera brumata]|uniref:Mediator of RNA polymerase II transcription subunit 21 n=1 Tax=Operophtera brumata TaxID=104452 RepID=A0A0L7LB75_OPEBR|nr:putative Srb7pRNA polymerase II holoenzyme component [Operophtera brumata]
MADRLTQLQDTINQQAEHFCNSIGILQQFSTPSKFPGFDRSGSQTPQQQQNQEDYAVLFAQLISRRAKDIDTLIESLPSALSDIAQCQLDMQNPALILNKEVIPQL